MPSPKAQELGIKSPFRMRGGIDFPSWEGLNLQNDPGAIRNTQFVEVINVRISGNDMVSRGGEEKIHTNALDGCVFGFFDVPEGATSLLLTTSTSDIGDDQMDRYYSEATPTYNNLFPINPTDTPKFLIQGLPKTATDLLSNANPRRSMARVGGHAYHFGDLDDGINVNPGLFKVVLPERTTTNSGNSSFENQAKREKVLDLPEFASWCIRNENLEESEDTDASIGEVLYIGSLTRGTVFRWDGTSLTEEDTNLPSTRIIVVEYLDDIWAMADDKLRRRNNGAWNEEYTFPASQTPNAAAALGNDLFIAQGDDVVVFDGAAFTSHEPNVGDNCLVVSDVKEFDGYIYYTWIDQSASPDVYVGRTPDGSAWTDNYVQGNIGDDAMCGCLEPSGFYLYWTYWNDSTGNHAILNSINPAGQLVELADEAFLVHMDLMAF